MKVVKEIKNQKDIDTMFNRADKLFDKYMYSKEERDEYYYNACLFFGKQKKKALSLIGTMMRYKAMTKKDGDTLVQTVCNLAAFE